MKLKAVVELYSHDHRYSHLKNLMEIAEKTISQPPSFQNSGYTPSKPISFTATILMALFA